MVDYSELRRLARNAAFVCCGNTTTGGEYAGQVECVCCGKPDETGDDVSIPATDLIALIAETERIDGCCKAMAVDMGKLTRERNSFRSSAEKLKAENEQLRALPQDWLAADLVKQLVDRAQAISGNADGEIHDFAIVLLASAERLSRQEAVIDRLRAENEALRKSAGQGSNALVAARKALMAARPRTAAHMELMTSALYAIDAVMSKGEQANG